MAIVAAACGSDSSGPDTNDTTPPEVVILQPTAGQHFSTGASIEVRVNTNENAFCSMSLTDQSYALMNPMTDIEPGINHRGILTGVPTGNRTLYVRCQDRSANRNTNTTSATVTFTVDPVTPN